MKFKSNQILLLAILIRFPAFVVSIEAQKAVKDLKPTVILIALDGFHPDYLTKYAAPNLNRLAKNDGDFERVKNLLKKS